MDNNLKIMKNILTVCLLIQTSFCFSQINPVVKYVPIYLENLHNEPIKIVSTEFNLILPANSKIKLLGVYNKPYYLFVYKAGKKLHDFVWIPTFELDKQTFRETSVYIELKKLLFN